MKSFHEKLTIIAYRKEENKRQLSHLDKEGAIEKAKYLQKISRFTGNPKARDNLMATLFDIVTLARHNGETIRPSI